MYESFSSPVDAGALGTSHSRTGLQVGGPQRWRPQPRSFDFNYVQRLRDGDPETEQHFTAYFGELLRIKLRARLRDANAIEDIRQETFLRVLNALKTKNNLRSPQGLGAFVNTVANNLVFELYRNQSRHRTVDTDEPLDLPDHHATAEVEMVAEERRQQVQRVLDELPARDRDLLRMTFCEEKDQDEICKSLHARRGYLRVLLHRAKARFRECLLKQYAMEGHKSA